MESTNLRNELIVESMEDGDHQHAQEEQDVRKKLTALINCAICLGTFRVPVKILACGHSYCYHCLIGLKESNAPITSTSSSNTNRRFIRCPTCRQETLLPRGLVKLLPTNYVLQQLLNAVVTNPQMDDRSINDQMEMIEESSMTESRTGMYALLIGDVNALEAVVHSVLAMTHQSTTTAARTGDWNCPSCNYYNYSFRTYCRWCPSPSPRLRPRIEIGYIEDAAVVDQIQLLASISTSTPSIGG